MEKLNAMWLSIIIAASNTLRILFQKPHPDSFITKMKILNWSAMQMRWKKLFRRMQDNNNQFHKPSFFPGFSLALSICPAEELQNRNSANRDEYGKCLPAYYANYPVWWDQ